MILPSSYYLGDDVGSVDAQKRNSRIYPGHVADLDRQIHGYKKTEDRDIRKHDSHVDSRSSPRSTPGTSKTHTPAPSSQRTHTLRPVAERTRSTSCCSLPAGHVQVPPLDDKVPLSRRLFLRYPPLRHFWVIPQSQQRVAPL